MGRTCSASGLKCMLSTIVCAACSRKRKGHTDRRDPRLRCKQLGREAFQHPVRSRAIRMRARVCECVPVA